MRAAIDFSNPEQVEEAFTAIQADIEKKNDTAEEEKEKHDAVVKALTNPKVAKLLAKVAEEDKDIKEAMEKDEDIKTAMKKANDEEDNDDKNSNTENNENKDADEKDEDLKAVVNEFKAKLISELVATQKAFGASDEQIKNYETALAAKSYTDVKAEHDNYSVQRNFIAATQSLPKQAQTEPSIPFNASYSTSNNSQLEGVYI